LRTERRVALLQLSDELAADDRLLIVLRVDRGLAWQEVARVFLEKEAPDDTEVNRESARLRKRFQIVRERLRDEARARGLRLDPAD
jgi:RNA polymerase sigma-70 factor (ECF subfamily)